jgi:hypothetical protein
MKRNRWKALPIAGVVIAVCAMIFVSAHAIGGTNPYTPAGHEGYVSHQPLWFGQRAFVGGQRGPTSSGWAWRRYVTNIDMRAQTYSETMQIFSADNLEVTFEAHARIRLRPGTVRRVVEHYSGDSWYANNVQRPFRTSVREHVRRHDAFEIKDLSEELGAEVLGRLRREYRRTPFEFMSVSIGNIDYPDTVEERVVANLAAEQRRQRMDVERQIALARAEIRETRAGGEARAQQIEQETLTPLFVQHEAAELYTALADDVADDDGVARATVVVVVPTRPDRAGVPRVYEPRAGEVVR